MKHEMIVYPNGRRACAHCAASVFLKDDGDCPGFDTKADFIEFKTRADAKKAQKLFQEMSNKITELEARVSHIEGKREVEKQELAAVNQSRVPL